MFGNMYIFLFILLDNNFLIIIFLKTRFVLNLRIVSGTWIYFQT